MSYRAVACALVVATTACSTAASAGGPPALQAVRSDAARLAGIEPRSLRVTRTEQKEWPDAALGCPRPGEMYAQVVTPGWLIEIRSGDRVFEYHTDARDRFVLCNP